MRILAITNLYPRPGFETLAVFNRQQFRALANRHEVHVIAPVPWPTRLRGLLSLKSESRQYVNSDGLCVYHPTYFYTPRVMQHSYGRFFLASVRRTAQGVIRNFKPNALLSCWAHPDGWATVQLARQAGLPALIKVGGSDVLVIAKNPRRRPMVAEALRQADGVIAVSHDLANHIIDLGVSPENIHVVPEGVDNTLFKPGCREQARFNLGLPINGKMILFVGNLLLSKGCGVLVEACHLLDRQANDFKCYMVGSGRDCAKIRSQIARCGLGDRIILVGKRAHNSLPDWYRACDLVVLPSYSEGIPNVLREAMMCGKPYVATRVGGIPEITHPSIGRLVSPGASRELAEAMKSVLVENPKVDWQLARKYNLGWDESARLLEERLQAIVANHAGPSQTCSQKTNLRNRSEPTLTKLVGLS
jgi:glycosyltransferase involved in cell wall biosynthesis